MFVNPQNDEIQWGRASLNFATPCHQQSSSIRYENAVSVAGITTNYRLSVARTHNAIKTACFLLKHHLLRDSVVHFERQRKTFAGILGSEIKRTW